MKTKYKIILLLSVLFSMMSCQTTKNAIILNKNIPNSTQIEVDYYITEGKKISKNQKYFEDAGIRDHSIFNYFDEIEFDEGSLLVLWKYNEEYASDNFFNNIKYLLQARPSLRLYWRNKGESYQKAVDQNYFKVNSRTEKANVYYVSAEKLGTENPIFKEKVVLTEQINFNNKIIQFCLPCFVVPFNTVKNSSWEKAATTDDIISIFGIPDKVESYFFSWLDEKTKNGIFYSPDVLHPVGGEHWRYKDYPDLVIDISSGKKVNDYTTNRDKFFYEEINK